MSTLRLDAARRLAHAESPVAWQRRVQATPRHALLTRVLHWSTAVLLVVALAAIVLRDYADSRALNVLLLVVHESCGIAVLALTVARLGWRIRARVGALHGADQPRVLHLCARAGHWALYGGLLALTILGWLTVDAHGRELVFLGAIRLPHLIARNGELADAIEQWHLRAAWMLLALVVGHVAFAMLHHHVLRDSVLTSMLPAARRSRRPIASRLRTILQQRRRIAAAAAPTRMRKAN